MKKILVSEHTDLIFGSFNNSLIRGTGYILECSAGVKIVFSVTTGTLCLGYTAEAHVNCRAGFGACPMKGLVYIIKGADGKILKRGAFINKFLPDEEKKDIITSNKPQRLFCEIWLPSMAAVSEVFVYVDDDALLTSTAKKKEDIFYIGGLATLGSGCTYQTSMMPNIVSDRLNYNTYNLAKTTGSFYDDTCINLVQQYRPSFVIVEAYSVTTGLDYLKDKLVNFINDLLSCNEKTILIFWEFPFISSRLNDNHTYYLKVKENFRQRNGNRCCFIDSTRLFRQSECDKFTISQFFMNDYANYIIADEIVNIVQISGGG